MFQRATLCALFALPCLFVCAYTLAEATPELAAPQAKPFVRFLQAIKADDADSFRDCQSKSIRESNQPWAQKLQEAKRSLSRRLGNYDISKFNYSFAGEDAQGDLTITYPDRDPMKLKVVKEGDDWKLASH